MGGGAAASDAADGVRQVGDVKLIARAVTGIDAEGPARASPTRARSSSAPASSPSSRVSEDGKAGIVVGVTADLTARFSAVDLVRKGAEALGGKGGGGRPDMAQAGGPDGSKADAALAAIEAALGGLISRKGGARPPVYEYRLDSRRGAGTCSRDTIKALRRRVLR